MIDADIIGINEIDTQGGKFQLAHNNIMDMMKRGGYSVVFKEKSDGLAGSAIFYRTSKVSLIEQDYTKASMKNLFA